MMHVERHWTKELHAPRRRFSVLLETSNKFIWIMKFESWNMRFWEWNLITAVGTYCVEHTVCVIHGKPELSIKGFPAELETSKFDLDHGMGMRTWVGSRPKLHYLKMHTSSGSEVLSSGQCAGLMANMKLLTCMRHVFLLLALAHKERETSVSVNGPATNWRDRWTLSDWNVWKPIRTVDIGCGPGNIRLKSGRRCRVQRWPWIRICKAQMWLCEDVETIGLRCGASCEAQMWPLESEQSSNVALTLM